jgi:SAM-dependent methyltransferase
MGSATAGREGLRVLGECLRGGGYTSANILATLHERPGAAAADAAVYEPRLHEPSALNLFIKLFTLGSNVPKSAAVDVLGAGNVETLLHAELARLEHGHLTPCLAVTEVDGLYIAHDRKAPGGAGRQSSEFVLGPNPSAITLAALTPRPQSRLTLDIGCGSGIQAFLAARHSDRVIATDINPRALRLGELSASLNAVTNIEWRQGSLFEPVEGLEFDLIVANPPFVISPDTTFMWRDGGLPAGGLNRELMRGIPASLAPQGLAFVLLNWPRRTGEDRDAVLRSWLGDGSCDTWVLHADSWDPLAYATRWTEPETASDGGATLTRWADFYAAEGIESLHFGAVMQRRPSSGEGWLRTDELPPTRLDPCGAQLLRAFDNYGRLQHLSDDEVLASPVRVPNGYRLEQQARVVDGTWTIAQLVLLPDPGVQFAGTLDVRSAEFLFQCSGTRTIAEALAAAGEEEPSDAIPAVRRMLALGSLEFVDVPGPAGSASDPDWRGDFV